MSAVADSPAGPDARGRLLVVALLALLAAVLLRSAWVSQDAYITFRTVDNWLNGFGLTWNAGERVQVYTHPLWMLCLATVRLLSGEFYFSSLALSLVMSLAAVAVLAFGLAGSAAAAAAALAALLSSKAFVDYSASGLEDPLTHLLLALGWLAVFRRSGGADGDASALLRLALCAALAALNRMDTLLLFLPLLGLGAWRCGVARAARALALGFLPLLLWEAFSLVYYGFPLPNTAYAKLDTGIDPLLLMRHGAFYLWNSLASDPVTLVVIAAGLALALRRRNPEELAGALGITLYLLWIVEIGGDFMAGRLLSAPFFFSVCLLARPAVGWRWGASAGLAVGFLGAWGSHPPLLSGADFGLPRAQFGQPGAPGPGAHGISDERWLHYQTTGLLGGQDTGLGGSARVGEHPWSRVGLEARERAPTVLVVGNIGLVGFHAGPEVTVIDTRALADPLLARLPASAGWRIGHFTRELPLGYLESVQQRRNLIQDPALADLHDALVLVTRGGLFEAGRFAEIWKLNTGYYADAIPSAR